MSTTPLITTGTVVKSATLICASTDPQLMDTRQGVLLWMGQMDDAVLESLRALLPLGPARLALNYAEALAPPLFYADLLRATREIARDLEQWQYAPGGARQERKYWTLPWPFRIRVSRGQHKGWFVSLGTLDVANPATSLRFEIGGAVDPSDPFFRPYLRVEH